MKIRRRQEAPYAPIDVSLEEDEEGTKLPDASFTKWIREARETSSLVKASILDAAELVGVSMGSKSYSDSSKAFVDFVKLVLAKLDLFEICSTKKD